MALTVFDKTQIGTVSSSSLIGTTTNDNAATGIVGEYVETSVLQGSGVSLGGTGVATDIGTITLTAGDWDVTLISNIDANGATVTYTEHRLGTVAGDNTTGTVFGQTRVNSYLPTSVFVAVATIRVRKSISTTTTFYWKASASYTVATPKGYGLLFARRVR